MFNVLCLCVIHCKEMTFQLFLSVIFDNKLLKTTTSYNEEMPEYHFFTTNIFFNFKDTINKIK